MIEKIFNQRLLAIVGIIACIELFSYLTTFVPALNAIITIAIFFIIFYIAKNNILLALQIAIGELVIGSKGYLLAAHYGNFQISSRMAIYSGFALCWIIFYAKHSNFWLAVKQRTEIKLLLLFALIVAWGLIDGILKDYPLANIFNDANGYFYLTLLPIFYDAVKSKSDFYKIIQVIIAGAFFVAIQTILLAYIFFHNIPIATYFMYKWIRIAGIGEITKLSLDIYFYRIFLQSQFYLVIGISLLSTLLKASNRNLKMFFILSGLFAALIISGSRSLWVGTIAVLSLIAIVTFIQKFRISQALKYFASILSSLIFGILITLIAVNFPLPIPQNFYAFNLMGQRLSAAEPAVSTRWKELVPLTEKIKISPIIGSGFGTYVSFNSDDPRVKNENNPNGEVTTFSFEWGYLDTITEIGLSGLAIFILYLISLLYFGYKKLTAESDEQDKLLSIGLMIGLISLAVIHTFSPYLNHPLGLGYLMILMAWIALPMSNQTSVRLNTENR